MKNAELVELILLLKLDKQFPVEQFEASRAIRGSSISVSSTLPPLTCPAGGRREERRGHGGAEDGERDIRGLVAASLLDPTPGSLINLSLLIVGIY